MAAKHEIALAPCRHGERAERGAVRRQAFLVAAREEFLAHGYAAASINEVVRRAGGSLATLYAQFGNKEGLFLAVMQAFSDQVIGEIAPVNTNAAPLEEGLARMGEQILRVLLRPDTLAFYRIIVGEGAQFPQLLQSYVSTSGDRIRAIVAGYLARHADAEGARIADPEAVAPYFLELLRARHHYRALADAAYTLSDADLAGHVRAAVQFFLNGALPRQAQAD